MCRMERVWDEADYVVPPAENGAFFVTTNIIVTPNQTWGSCPEVSRLKGKQLFEAEQLMLNYLLLTKSESSTWRDLAFSKQKGTAVHMCK